jgi:negative regulator of sigma-B (phosphoserine phosphatase)
MEKIDTSGIEWGVAFMASPGQKESGDKPLVMTFTDGVLVAVVDGIGHGNEAGEAAQAAIRTLESRAHDPVISLVQRCHENLRATRGVVMSVASFDLVHGLMTWLGVGNVEGILLRPNPGRTIVLGSLLLRSGVVGAQLPPLQAAVLPVARMDTLIFATDGVRADFLRGFIPGGPPQKTAERILAKGGKGTDDALVLAARYIGL